MIAAQAAHEDQRRARRVPPVDDPSLTPAPAITPIATNTPIHRTTISGDLAHAQSGRPPIPVVARLATATVATAFRMPTATPTGMTAAVGCAYGC